MALNFQHYLVEVWNDTSGRWGLQGSAASLPEAEALFTRFAGQRRRLVRVLEMEFEEKSAPQKAEEPVYRAGSYSDLE